MTPEPSVSTLAALSPGEAAQVAAVTAHIRTELEHSDGWIPFERYMELALYAPALGYYSAGATKLGVAGDFVTAPEISDLFAGAVAAQFAEILQETGGGVLELGAGTGRFAGAALRSLADRRLLPDGYSILEVSADLIARQRDAVASMAGGFASRATWLSRLPKTFSGVVFANEVLDALPCDRFVIANGQPERLGVQWDGRRFGWAACSAAAAAADDAWRERVTAALAGLAPLPEGYCGEVCLNVEAWIAGIAAALERAVVILIDYGLPRRHYYHPERSAGTLRAHFRHRALDDPFWYPGLCDLSAWVDFTRVAEAGQAAGLELAGFTTQAAFLLANGIGEQASTLSARGQAEQAHALRQLLLPGEMGEAVKVMMLSKGVDRAWQGLALVDLRDSL